MGIAELMSHEVAWTPLQLDKSKHEKNSTMAKFRDIVAADFLTTSIFWGGINLVSLIMYLRSKNYGVLKHGALISQFIIHGNDLGFGNRLLEASCYNNDTEQSSQTDITVTIFKLVQSFTTLKSFLFFFPFTFAIVTMATQKVITAKGFFIPFFGTLSKFGLSYVGFVVGILIKKSNYHDYSHFFDDMFNLAAILQILTVGVYLYHIAATVRIIKVDIKILLMLMVSVSLLFPLVHTTVFALIGRKKIYLVMDFGHASVPSSLYIQYYILRVTKNSSNYIISFVGTTFLGTLLMYVLIFSYSTIELNELPLDFFEKTQRDNILLASIFFLIPAAMMFVRLRQAKLRTILLFLLISYSISHLFQAGYCFYIANHDHFQYFSAFASGIAMVHFIFSNTMLGFCRLYKHYRLVSRSWKVILWGVFSMSVITTTVLYSSVMLTFQNEHVTYGMVSFLFLDITKETNHYHIGSISYCIISVLILAFHGVVIHLCHRGSANVMVSNDSRILEDASQSGLMGTPETDHSEKFLSVKIFFYYNMGIVLTVFVGAMCVAIDPPDVEDGSRKNMNGFYQCPLFVAELMTDFGGLVFTLLFCITPGDMEKEFERFMYFPHKLKYLFQMLKPIQDVMDADNLSMDVIDRCRRFMLYHKRAFTNLYDMTNGNIFTGSQLIHFLIATEVADSKSEAIDISNSYLAGGIFKQQTGLVSRAIPYFFETHRYTFNEDVPDFVKIFKGAKDSMVHHVNY